MSSYSSFPSVHTVAAHVSECNKTKHSAPNFNAKLNPITNHTGSCNPCHNCPSVNQKTEKTFIPHQTRQIRRHRHQTRRSRHRNHLLQVRFRVRVRNHFPGRRPPHCCRHKPQPKPKTTHQRHRRRCRQTETPTLPKRISIRLIRCHLGGGSGHSRTHQRLRPQL